MNQEEQNNEFYQKLMELSEVDDKFKKGLEGLSDKEKLEQYIPQYDGVMDILVEFCNQYMMLYAAYKEAISTQDRMFETIGISLYKANKK